MINYSGSADQLTDSEQSSRPPGRSEKCESMGPVFSPGIGAQRNENVPIGMPVKLSVMDFRFAEAAADKSYRLSKLTLVSIRLTARVTKYRPARTVVIHVCCSENRVGQLG